MSASEENDDVLIVSPRHKRSRRISYTKHDADDEGVVEEEKEEETERASNEEAEEGTSVIPGSCQSLPSEQQQQQPQRYRCGDTPSPSSSPAIKLEKEDTPSASQPSTSSPSTASSAPAATTTTTPHNVQAEPQYESETTAASHNNATTLIKWLNVLEVMRAVGCEMNPTSPGIPHDRLMCAECTTNEATVWCQKEEIALCAQCDAAAHQLKISKGHQRVPIESSMKPKRSFAEPKCPVHPNKDLDIWCEDDQTLCCLLCKEESHKGHNVSFRDDAHRSAIERMTKASKHINAMIHAGASKVVEEQKAQDKLKGDAKNARDNIEAAFVSFYKALDQQKAHLLSQLEEAQETLSSALAKSTETTVFSIGECQQINDAIEHLQKCDNTFSVLQMLSLIHKKERTSGALHVRDFVGAECKPLPRALPLGKLTFLCDTLALTKSLSNFGSIFHFPLLEGNCTVGDTTTTIQWNETESLIKNPEEKFSYQWELLRGNAIEKDWVTKRRKTKLAQPQLADETRIVRMRAFFGHAKNLIKQPHNASPWFETSFSTQPYTVFSQPGTYIFTVPEGVASINAILIGGGGAGGSWGKGKPRRGTNGGDSIIEGIVRAGGGKAGSSRHGGCEGGRGTTANGGSGGKSDESGNAGSHGGGGGAGGQDGGADYPKSGSRKRGGPAERQYAGCGGSGRGWGDHGKVLSSSMSGPDSCRQQPEKPHGGQPGWNYGGGGGGSFSCGGGGGGYSTLKNHPVNGGQELVVVVGEGGEPERKKADDENHIGGPGGCGLVFIGWAKTHFVDDASSSQSSGSDMTLADVPKLKNPNNKRSRDIVRRVLYVYFGGALQYPPIAEDPYVIDFLTSPKYSTEKELLVEIVAARGLNVTPHDSILCKLSLYNAPKHLPDPTNTHSTDPITASKSNPLLIKPLVWKSLSFHKDKHMGSLKIPLETIPLGQSKHWYVSMRKGPYPIIHNKGRTVNLPVVEEPNTAAQQRAREEARKQKSRFGTVGSLRIRYLYAPSTRHWDGAITIDVISAKNLTSCRSSGVLQSYVFCVVTFGAQKFKTQAQKKAGGLFQWNETFFCAISPSNALLGNKGAIMIELYEWDRLGSHLLLGSVQLILCELPPNEDSTHWYPIMPEPSEVQVGHNPAQKMKEEGWVPRFPVVIVPGFASSALMVCKGPISAWQNQIVWLSLSKIGSQSFRQMGTTVQSVFSKTASVFSGWFGSSSDSSSQSTNPEDVEFKNLFVKYISLNPSDGRSDPPGLQIRAVPGTQGALYLDPGVVSSLSWVMGPLVECLREFGYTDDNLVACPYDWRLDPECLEMRDAYFTDLKETIQRVVRTTGNKVCLLGHSMGNRTIQYFLNKVKVEVGQRWIDDHIHEFIAVGAPFLGAPKTIRSLCTGDRFGLDALLEADEALAFSRTLGSSPQLLPLGLGHYFEDRDSSFVYLHETDTPNHYHYKPLTIKESLIKSGAIKPLEFFEQYYLNNPFYGGLEGKEAILEPPPVQRLYAIYGVNLPTEKYYFYKNTPHGFIFDGNPQVNLPGIKISNGIGYETDCTPQKRLAEQMGVYGTRSGDGTVPWQSLNYCTHWRTHIPYLEVQELQHVEHREILRNKLFWQLLLERISQPPANLQRCPSQEEPVSSSHPSQNSSDTHPQEGGSDLSIPPSSSTPVATVSNATPTTAATATLNSPSSASSTASIAPTTPSAPVASTATTKPSSSNQTDIHELVDPFATSTVLKAGFLIKRGSVMKRKWKSKFFVLYTEHLAYYRSPCSPSAKGVIPVKNMDCLRVAECDPGGGQHLPGFEIVTPKETFHLCAQSHEEIDCWFSVLASLHDHHEP
ncbi:Lecithin:cholesterol acyltransferase [Pelomyxa schiedti]|nr:Lecithin:cholesterol acyltransferase [Pelomyxa schiedti]